MKPIKKFGLWLAINVGSFVIPLALAWLWIYQERNALLASKNPLWTANDTPPILAIMATSIVWLMLLVVVNAGIGVLLWNQSRRERSRQASPH